MARDWKYGLRTAVGSRGSADDLLVVSGVGDDAVFATTPLSAVSTNAALLINPARDAVSNALQVHSLDWSGDTSGSTALTPETASTVTASTVTVTNASGITADTLVGTQSVAAPVSDMVTVIDAGATLELAHAYSGTISFAGGTGTLIIDHSSSFSGTISGQLGIGNVIDLADITGGANVTIAYSGNNSPGTLTVSDGTHTVNIALEGNYSLANFTASGDGHGGTSVVDPPVLPAGVTLKAIDGGANYYGDHGLTYAHNAGWDSSVIPIGPWYAPMHTQTDANRWLDLGFTTAFVLTGDSDLRVLRNNGLTAVLQTWQPDMNNIIAHSGGALGSETVGLMTADEGNFQNNLNAITTTPNSLQDGRFWYTNNTWNFVAFGPPGDTPAPVTQQHYLTYSFTTPDGSTRHLDVSSIDDYFFAGAAAQPLRYALGVMDGLGRDATPDEISRGSNYGDLISYQQAFTGGTTPLYAFIEDGGPYGEDTTASTYITPAELNWAVWSSLIHGARGIEYFNHSFGGPAQSNDNLSQPYYQTVQPGQTVSIYTQVKNTDALVQQLAPVLNSPTALGYVTVSNPHYQNGTITSKLSGIEVTAKDYNGQFYIFADTADSLTQTNIPATFTIADKNATSVTVVNENRTISVVNGVFTDTFATAATVHIYQVNDGPAGPTPPPTTSIPTISSFSTDSGTAGDGITNNNTLMLTGIAVANSTVNVYDGTTLLGTATASGSGAWNYTTATLANGGHSFTATDTVSGSTSAASSALSVTVDTVTPGKPVISSNAVSSSNVVTLNGTAEANSTVTVFDGTTQLGTATANGSGAWSFATASLPNGNHSLTATDTDAAGNTSAVSSSVNLTLSAPVIPADPAIPVNLVTNGSFETGNFSGWTLGGSSGVISAGPQVYINGQSESGQHAAALGSVGSDGILSQTLQTTAGQQYTLSFWLANQSAGPDDFTAKWNGTTLLPLVNASAQGYTQYTFNVTATGATSTLEFDARQDPSHWSLDNISVTTSGPQAPTTPIPTITSFSPDTGVVGDGITDPAILTLTGTAVANSTVTVFDGTTKLGAATADASGAWSLVTAALPDGIHKFTATDTVSGSTSAASSALSVTVDTVTPGKPVISSNAVSPSNVVTLNGTAEADSTVTVFDGTTQLGTATANGSGAWSFATASLPNGNHSLTATDTDAAGNTSAVSSSVNLTLSAPVIPVDPVIPADPAIPVNLVTNGSFETGNFSGWTLGGSSGVISAGPQMYINGQSESGQHAAALGSVGSDGILSQTLETTAGQQYTLSFWLANQSAGPDDFTAKWNGTTLLPLVNASAQGYTQYTFNVTATGTTSTLEFDARQDPSHWSLDNISVTASGTQAPTTPMPTVTSPDTGVVGDGITDPAVTVDTVAPAKPVIGSNSVSPSNVVTLNGTAEADSTVTVFDGTTQLGTATANGSGAWSFATASLPNGNHSLTATDTDAAGNTSAVSSSVNLTLSAPVIPVDPVIPADPAIPVNLVTNGSFETGNFSGWTLGGSSGVISAGPQMYINGQSESGQHAAALGSVGSDGILSQTLETTAGQQYTLSFWLANQSAGPDDFTAKWNGTTLLPLVNASAQGYTQYTFNVTATGTTSTLEFDARQDPSHWSLDNISVTASGTQAPTTPMPTVTSPDTGVVGDGITDSFATASLPSGNHSLTATDTDAAGNTSAVSSSVNLTLSAPVIPVDPVIPADPAIPVNLVTNGSFETGNFSGWTLGGSSGVISAGPQMYINGQSESGQHAAALGSVGSDGILSQTLETTAGQQYTLSFWLANQSAGPDDFTAKWNDTTLLPLVNASAQGYTQYTFNVTATGTTSTLEFDARQDPSHWSLDNISVTAVGPQAPAAPVIASDTISLNGSLGGQTLNATGGATTLIGGPNDILNGGAGADTFVFPANFGSNTVNNFAPGTDALKFSQSMFATVAAVLNDAQQVGSNVVITHDPQNVVTLHHTQLSNLHASDIHIV